MGHAELDPGLEPDPKTDSPILRAAQERIERERHEAELLASLTPPKAIRFDPVLTEQEREAMRRARWADADEPQSAQEVCFQPEGDARVENTRCLEEEGPRETCVPSIDASSVFNTARDERLPWKNRPRRNTSILALACRMLAAHGSVTTKELANAAGVTRPTARKWLDHLVERGVASREGLKTTRRYHARRSGS